MSTTQGAQIRKLADLGRPGQPQPACGTTAPEHRSSAPTRWRLDVIVSPASWAQFWATRALLADGARKVVLAGFSRGALVALGVAPKLGPRISGVISISGGPSPSEGFPTIRSLAAFHGPILLVSSKYDPVFPPGTSAAIAAVHHGPDTLVVVPGSDHALQLLDGPYSHHINTAINAFLARLL